MAAQSGTETRGDTDLLKRPALQNNGSQGTEDSLSSGHIGSSTPSPSGISTPQPDPADKRQPSIVPSYFQVGSSPSGSKLNSLDLWFSGLKNSSTVDKPRTGSQGKATRDAEGLNCNSSSFESLGMASKANSSALPDGKLETEELPLVLKNPTNLPTPPLSDPCSLLQKESDETDTGASSQEKGVGSIFTALRDYLSPRNTFSEPQSLRHTSPSVSGISSDPVLASDFSSPTLPQTQDVFSSSPVPLLDHEKPPAPSPSCENLARLTGNVPDGSRLKNTPPLTPRAMSNEKTQADEQPDSGSPLPPSSDAAPEKQTDNVASIADDIAGRLDKAFPPQEPNVSTQGASSQGGPPVGPLKGKLIVRISEARGLRPSFDPYVVCVFEWNEFVSNGAQSEEETALERRRVKKELEPDAGRPMAIPMKSRQSSSNSLHSLEHKSKKTVTDPHWNLEAAFDVLGEQSEIDISVYDRYNQEEFLGHTRLCINLRQDHSRLEGWFPLAMRGAGDHQISGEIHLEITFEKTDQKQVGPNDFKILKLIGKGTFGQVYQVKKKDTRRIYAMKVLSKKVIIQKKEVAHTLGERNILVRTAMAASPFIVGLKFSFQTPTDLYLVTDYMSGGELFWHLQKEGRFPEARAKFYIAELILALQHLHDHDIVYRDLKPENILLDANGHIALCDFGLSKANLTQGDTTNTFCGTTEYLAPEVLLDEQGYTKMVDFWSLGVLVFEMCCGWSPFYAEDTQQMYKNIAFGKVRFPRDALSTEGRNFVKGLLNRNPKHRLGAKGDAKELIAHPFFHDVDWEALSRKEVVPPFKPKLKSDTDTSNFDPEFTNALDISASLNDRAAALANNLMGASTPLSPGMQANFKGFTFVNESSVEQHLKNVSTDRAEEDSIKDEDLWQRSHRSGHSVGGAKPSDPEAGVFHVDENFDM